MASSSDAINMAQPQAWEAYDRWLQDPGVTFVDMTAVPPAKAGYVIRPYQLPQNHHV
jgi:hypothetical protein